MNAAFPPSLGFGDKTPAVAFAILLVMSTSGHAAPEISGRDWFGDHAQKSVRLEQGWSPAESDWFYWTTQGSQLLPYAFFLALEQPGNQSLFRDPRNMRKYRFLPEPPRPANPDGLPVGLTADAASILPAGLITDRRSIGFTCAACHTMQINYQGTAMRLDGATALADIAGFLAGLTSALQATETKDGKFERFASRVLGKDASLTKRTELRATLKAVVRKHEAYQNRNRSDVAEGFGRLDAFGRIYSSALSLVDPKNHHEPDAPVSFPQLWDSTRLDYVQFTGVARNGGVGPLMRNIGQIVGVFATVDSGEPPPTVGYHSSVNFRNLRALERQLKSLKSPAWPEGILPPIDRNLAATGREVFVRTCRGCHHDYARDDRSRIVTTRVPLSRIKTDPRAAENLMNARGSTGFLAGTKQSVVFGRPMGTTDTAFHITRNTVVHMLLGKMAPGLSDNPMRHVNMSTTEQVPATEFKTEPQLQYKARPHNGVWSTAPYLHNGSVPNLYELLLPADQRSKTFSVGRREFDPVKVGFVTAPAEGTFTFDTTIPGNTNVGHPFAARLTEAERWQVIEYLKTL